MIVAPFTVRVPHAQSTSVLFASPHSGRDYPSSFLRASVLKGTQIRSSEDAYIDDLISDVAEFGAASIVAHVPRAYIDLNRGADELDSALISGLRRGAHNPRVASGLGVIPRVVANGREIYHGKISLDEARERIDTCWHPYHERLSHLMQDTKRLFGEAILLDIHSMPHEAISSFRTPQGQRPEVVLGDRFGAAASSKIVEHVEGIFAAAGLNVVRNAPFAGAYIAQRHGRPARGLHVIQVEIDRALYLDEARVEKSAGFGEFKRILSRILSEVADLGRPALPLAAE